MALLWLRCRAVAAALIQTLAQELPYSAGVALKIYIYYKKEYIEIYPYKAKNEIKHK